MTAEEFWPKWMEHNYSSVGGERTVKLTWPAQFAEAYAASLLASRDRELREIREALQEAVRWERGPFANASQIGIPAWVERAKALLARTERLERPIQK
jgi:hypothetical protein